MPDLTPCPSCQSVLRIPVGASMIRCPNCKTVLAVEQPQATTPPTPPPPAPAKPALPLPFGKGKATPAAKPAQAKPTSAKPAKSATKSSGPLRAKLAPVDEDDLDDDTDLSSEEVARRKQLKKELRRFEEEEELREEEYQELEDRCKLGQKGTQILAMSTYFQALGLASFLAVNGLYAFTNEQENYLRIATYLGLGLGGLMLLLAMIGFGICIAGPVKARHIAIGGLLVSLAQLLLCCGQFAKAAEPTSSIFTLWADTLPIQDRMGMISNLPLLAEFPARLFQLYGLSWFGLVAAAMEFARLVMVGMLTQQYAIEGKDPELGHKASELTNRIFWIVLLSALFRLAASSAFDTMPPADALHAVGHGCHVVLMVGTVMFIVINLVWLGQAMWDTQDLVDARRYADPNERLSF